MSVPGRWFLVELSDGRRDVVNATLIDDCEVVVGDSVEICSRGGERQVVKLMKISDNRECLLQCLNSQDYIQDEAGEPGARSEDPEGADYSPSASSWDPDSSCGSDSDQEVNSKALQLSNRQFTFKRRGKKDRVPTLRANAVIPQEIKTYSSHRKNTKKKSNLLPPTPLQQDKKDYRKGKTCDHVTQTESQLAYVTIEELNKVREDVYEVNENLRHMKSIIDSIIELIPSERSDLYQTIYPTISGPRFPRIPTPEYDIPIAENDAVVSMATHEVVDQQNAFPSTSKDVKPLMCEVEKNTTAIVEPDVDNSAFAPPPSSKKNKKRRTRQELTSNEENNDLVPIGSGHTLVPGDDYDLINWGSYTMATRKLLIAVFPRRVLATHSLTGKASPAFTDRPAKLCLDPKKVSDIVIEVANRCNVKEGLVRNAITTKCADENKMQRIKAAKEKKTRNMRSAATATERQRRTISRSSSRSVESQH